MWGHRNQYVWICIHYDIIIIIIIIIIIRKGPRIEHTINAQKVCLTRDPLSTEMEDDDWWSTILRLCTISVSMCSSYR